MAAKKAKQTENRILLQTVETKLGDGLGQADGLRHEGLAGLAIVKRVKLVQVRMERGRMEAKYDADHPRVQQLDRQMVAEHQAMVFARMERDKTGVEIPERVDDKFILFGHVKDEDGYPLRDYQVGLYPNTTAKAVAVVDDITDKHGVFKMSVPIAAINAAAGAEVQQQEPLYLMVRNTSGKIMHKDSKPVEPVANGLVHRGVVLSVVSQAGCGCCQTQFLGNSNTREVHDLVNEKPRCQLANMRPDHRVYYASTEEAQKAGYDFCAYCFSKKQSRR